MAENKHYHKDRTFQDFAKLVDKKIKVNAKTDHSTQKQHVEQLLKLEKDFSAAISGYSQTDEIYRQFIVKIVVKNKNLLSAKPYFRDRSPVFTSQITPAIKDVNTKKLKTFNINYNLIKFIRDSWKGQFPKKAQKIFDQIEITRALLVENNIPLAINRAKRFYKRVPERHLSLMDMVALCVAGLVVGVDKWSGPYSTVFRSTCIGWMTANLLEAYNETPIKLSPSEKNIVYRASAIKIRNDGISMDELAEAVSLPSKKKKRPAIKTKQTKEKKITGAELSNLMNAANSVAPVGEILGDGHETEESSSFDFLPSGMDVEEACVQNDILTKAYAISESFDIITIKVIKLKGMLT